MRIPGRLVKILDTHFVNWEEPNSSSIFRTHVTNGCPEEIINIAAAAGGNGTDLSDIESWLTPGPKNSTKDPTTPI